MVVRRACFELECCQIPVQMLVGAASNRSLVSTLIRGWGWGWGRDFGRGCGPGAGWGIPGCFAWPANPTPTLPRLPFRPGRKPTLKIGGETLAIVARCPPNLHFLAVSLKNESAPVPQRLGIRVRLGRAVPSIPTSLSRGLEQPDGVTKNTRYLNSVNTYMYLQRNASAMSQNIA